MKSCGETELEQINWDEQVKIFIVNWTSINGLIWYKRLEVEIVFNFANYIGYVKTLFAFAC